MKSQRVECVDLSDRFASGRPFSDCYFDVADVLLKGAGEDRPVVFLTQGNPLFLNSLNRFLILKARERELVVQTLPGVSPLDTIISDLGLDVGNFGLQLFDARRLVARGQQVNTAVPLLVLQVGGFAAETVASDADADDNAAYEALAGYLSQLYPPDHSVTLVNTGGGAQAGRSTVRLDRFSELVPHISVRSSLFVDALRQRAAALRAD